MKIETNFTFDSVDHSKENEVHAVITLKAPKLDWEKKRQPICVLPVIDISTSMSGEKLEYAKMSVIKLIDQLQPDDYCGVVAFGSRVIPLAEPRKMTQTQKDALKAKVGAVSPEGCTNFSGGMRHALEWVNNLDISSDVILRVIMFTDGHANEGEARGRALIPLCEKLLGKASLSAFGYGEDADQELLADLATTGKGNYCFIKNPDDALTAFARELGGLLSRYAQDLVVDVAPFNGHKIEEVLSDVDVDEDGGKIRISFPEILSEEERHIVLLVKTSKQNQALPRALNVLDVKVSYDHVSDGDKLHREEEVKAKMKFVKPGEEQSKPSDKLMNIVGMALTVKAQVEAEEQAKQGNWDAAQNVLLSNANVMRSFNLHTHAQVSSNLGGNYATQDSYMCSSGVRSSMRRGMSRSAGSSKEVEHEIKTMGGLVSNTAMNSMESAFDVDNVQVDRPPAGVLPSVDSLSAGPALKDWKVTTPPAVEDSKKRSSSKISKSRSKRW